MSEKTKQVCRSIWFYLSHHYTLSIISFILFGITCCIVYKGSSTNKFELIASLTTTLTIVIAIIAIIATNRQHRENSRRATAEKAIEIARYFQEKLLHDLSFLTVALRSAGQSEYEQCPALEKATLSFTREEFREIFDRDAGEVYQELYKAITPEVLGKAAYFADRVATKTEALSGAKIVNMRNAFNEKRMSMLNTLEWVAMTINTGVADETVIYQSLHQTLLPYVRLEYPNIAHRNSDDCANGQYYTNLIKLYSRWQKIKLKHQAIDSANARRNERDNQKMQRKIKDRRNNNVKHAPHV